MPDVQFPYPVPNIQAWAEDLAAALGFEEQEEENLYQQHNQQMIRISQMEQQLRQPQPIQPRPWLQQFIEPQWPRHRIILPPPVIQYQEPQYRLPPPLPVQPQLIQPRPWQQQFILPPPAIQSNEPQYRPPPPLPVLQRIPEPIVHEMSRYALPPIPVPLDPLNQPIAPIVEPIDYQMRLQEQFQRDENIRRANPELGDYIRESRANLQEAQRQRTDELRRTQPHILAVIEENPYASCSREYWQSLQRVKLTPNTGDVCVLPVGQPKYPSTLDQNERRQQIESNEEWACTVCELTAGIDPDNPVVLLHAVNVDKGDFPQGDIGHLFHKRCIEAWFARHNTCPICRQAAQHRRKKYPLSSPQKTQTVKATAVKRRMRTASRSRSRRKKSSRRIQRMTPRH